MQRRATDTTHVVHETDVTIRIWRTGRPRCLSIHTRSSHFWEWCEIEAFVLVNMSLSTVSPLLPDAHHRPTAIWCATKNRGGRGEGAEGGQWRYPGHNRSYFLHDVNDDDNNDTTAATDDDDDDDEDDELRSLLLVLSVAGWGGVKGQEGGVFASYDDDNEDEWWWLWWWWWWWWRWWWWRSSGKWQFESIFIQFKWYMAMRMMTTITG